MKVKFFNAVKMQSQLLLGFNVKFRSDIEIGNITGEDVLSVLPFNNTIDRLVMNGKGIRAVLNNFADGLCPDQSCYPGTFLQVFWSL
jgi:2',3'-cyclic-nucleotide 2'-phosphodiesterase (5'-nucleotidase family)